jgi:hypothetical protein
LRPQELSEEVRGVNYELNELKVVSLIEKKEWSGVAWSEMEPQRVPGRQNQ